MQWPGSVRRRGVYALLDEERGGGVPGVVEAAVSYAGLLERGPAHSEDRKILKGMVSKIRTGISWRDLPTRYGPWKTVCACFRRYALRGVRPVSSSRSRPADSAGDDDRLVQADSTVVRPTSTRRLGREGELRRTPGRSRPRFIPFGLLDQRLPVVLQLYR